MQWHDKYSIDQFLAHHSITPGGKYLIGDIHLAMKQVLWGKVPAMDCFINDQEEVFLTQITLCFNLKLQLIHCKKEMFGKGIFGNCPPKALASYPQDDHDLQTWTKVVASAGWFVGFILLLWLAKYGYQKYREYRPTPVTRGRNGDSETSNEITYRPFNIDIDDLIDRYRALGRDAVA